MLRPNELFELISAFYNLKVKCVDGLNSDNDAFKITDISDVKYFLKIYSKNNGGDINPGENVYHTYEQLLIKAELLARLTDSDLKTAAPIKNAAGDYITAYTPDNAEPLYILLTEFVDGLSSEQPQTLTPELAYMAGEAAARLHLVSADKLLPLAVRRPHKRQDYVRKILDRLAAGLETGILTAAQYNMLCECGGVIIDCMNRLDADPKANAGLVHTDIRNGNIVYAEGRGVLIDFSRCVYSYYLYDLGEMCFHGNFGGADPGLQKAILRGYNSVKPLTADHLFIMQAMFAMFILMVIAESINDAHSPWRDAVLKWFASEVHPGLVSGGGWLGPEFANIIGN